MKKRHVILIVILLLICGAGVGLQIFLTRGLASTLNEKVFPEYKEKYELDISVKNASVNLLQRRIRIEGLALKNIEGYEAESMLSVNVCKVDVDLISLLKRTPIILNSVELTGSSIVIEKKDEKVNFDIAKDNISEAKKKEAAEADMVSAEPEVTAPAVEGEEPLVEEAMQKVASGVQIRSIAVSGNVSYIDHDQDREFPLSLRLTGREIYTEPAEWQPESLLVLRGSKADNSDSCIIDINAIVSPLVDLEKPTFRVSGTIKNLDKKYLEEIFSKNDMESGNFSLGPAITSEGGDLKGSELEVSFDDLKYRDISLGNTSLEVPIFGNLEEPKYDLTGAIRSLVEKSSVAFLKSVGVKEILIEYNRSSSDSEDSVADDNSATGDELSSTAEAAESIEEASEEQEVDHAISDILIDELSRRSKEVEDSSDLKKVLKNLGDSLLGD